MLNLEFKDVLEICTIGFLILGTAWRLSRQLSAIETKLDLHMKQDDERFNTIDDVLDDIAPRVIASQGRRR